jgi:tocopherol cyclase
MSWWANPHFSEKGIQLDIETEDLKIKGEVFMADFVKYPSSAFSPGIMGWYSFVPFMECKHGIGSVLHLVKRFDFD